MIAIDHVIVAVDDLAASAQMMLAAHGLAAVPGGRHAGHGTGNRIVPLGPNYLELMAVIDPVEAAGSPLGRWVLETATADLAPAAVCLRTDDIRPIAAALGEDPEPMSRQRPDGSTLDWLLAGLPGMLGPERLPFFIEWHCDPDDHPGRTLARHIVEPAGISEVVLGAGRLQDLIDGADGVTPRTTPGVGSVVIQTGGGPVTLD